MRIDFEESCSALTKRMQAKRPALLLSTAMLFQPGAVLCQSRQVSSRQATAKVAFSASHATVVACTTDQAGLSSHTLMSGRRNKCALLLRKMVLFQPGANSLQEPACIVKAGRSQIALFASQTTTIISAAAQVPLSNILIFDSFWKHI